MARDSKSRVISTKASFTLIKLVNAAGLPGCLSGWLLYDFFLKASLTSLEPWYELTINLWWDTSVLLDLRRRRNTQDTIASVKRLHGQTGAISIFNSQTLESGQSRHLVDNGVWILTTNILHQYNETWDLLEESLPQNFVNCYYWSPVWTAGGRGLTWQFLLYKE